MKILHITSYITGGAGIAVLRLHKALLKNGIDSKVLCLLALEENLEEKVYPIKGEISVLSKIKQKLKLDKGSKLTKGLQGDYEAFTTPYTAWRIHEHPLVKEADVIHLHWISEFVDIPSFFSLVRKPIVWTLHDLNPLMGGFHYENDLKLNPSFAPLEEKLKKDKHTYISRANIHFIGSSSFTVAKIIEYLPDAKYSKIPCVLDTLHYRSIEKKIARKALGIEENKLVLGSGADHLQNYRKGFWLLLGALSLLSPEEKSLIKILSFGTAGRHAGEIHGSPEMIMLEPIQDKHLHSLVYSAMDFFVVPSLEETFGLTGTEALLCNTPLIASKTGGIKDYTVENVTALTFDTGNVEELSAKIKLVIREKQLHQQQFLQCRENLLKWYDQEDPINKHIQLYQNLIQDNFSL